MPEYTFDTPEPVDLRVNNPSGEVHVNTDDVATTTVHVEGDSKRFDEEVEVEQRGNQIRVKIQTSRRNWGGDNPYEVHVTVPTHSQARVETASAEVMFGGTYDEVRATTASGEIHLDVARTARLETASGEISVHHLLDDSQLTTASGEIRVGRCDGDRLQCSSASGEIEIGSMAGEIRANAASGDIHLEEVVGDIHLAAASGDIDVEYVFAGELTVETVSGDVEVGVADGTAIWLDINSMTGDVDIEQEIGSEPEPGQPTLRLRCTSLSGDIEVHRVERRHGADQTEAIDGPGDDDPDADLASALDEEETAVVSTAPRATETEATPAATQAPEPTDHHDH